MTKIVETPRLTAKELEKELLRSIGREPDLIGNRYGELLQRLEDGSTLPLASYPDIEGVKKPRGRQFIIECKKADSKSFRLVNRITFAKNSRQLKTLLAKSEFGVVTGYLIHFNKRIMKTFTDPPLTFIVPVHPNLPLWIKILDGELNKLDRDVCMRYGQEVQWHLPKRCKNPVLKFAEARDWMETIIDDCNEEPIGYEWIKSEIFLKDDNGLVEGLESEQISA